MLNAALPPWLAAPDVERAVRTLPGFRDASLLEWAGAPLSGGAGECLGVWRLKGLATVERELTPWSIVLKGWAGQETDDPPAAWNWPYREVELYRSGLLGNLPGGIRAPRCFGDVERDDGSVWLWLEDITDGLQGPWSIERFGTVARQLGQFNGAWLVDRPLPDASFLSRNWLRDWTELSGPAYETFLADPDLCRRSAVYPPEVMEWFGRLWSQRHSLYREMSLLPQTFCHLDAFSRNVFIRQRSGEPDDTILIDWSFAGIATLGEELVALVGASVDFLDAPVSDIQEIFEAAIEGYIAGLQDAGWRADPAVLRRVFYAATGLRYGIGAMRFFLFGLLDPAGTAMIEQMVGHSAEEIQANSLEFYTWLARSSSAQDRRPNLRSHPAAR